jgi:hypothetical protein
VVGKVSRWLELIWGGEEGEVRGGTPTSGFGVVSVWMKILLRDICGFKELFM